MWTFEQLTGRLINDAGDVIGIGYAGKGAGKNNPQLQNVEDIGPLPQGMYTIGAPVNDSVVGRFAMRLWPAQENQMFNRANFFIHGDNPKHIGQSSDGCIIMSLDVRQQLWNSKDHLLKVVDGQTNFETIKV